MNNKFKILILNIAIILIAIFAYSPGFLNLRPSDVSIFRAGMSIITALALIFAFIYGNLTLLKEPEKVVYNNENVRDLNEAKQILSNYRVGDHFAEIASTAISQIDRLGRSTQRATIEINKRFERGSLSWQKYHGAIEEANGVALDNIITLANRMQLFDEKEYKRLKNYKNDNIPDDIQEKQIMVYEQNTDLIKSAITVNENLILGLDTLSIELAKPVKIEDQNTTLLSDIKKLTDEVKYYI